MAKTPYIDLRDAIAAELAATSFAVPLTVVASHRPIIDLPAGIGAGVFVNIFHANRRTDQQQRAGVDRYYETIVAVHQQLAGDTHAALDALTDQFEFVAYQIEQHLEKRNFLNDRFLWWEFETPGADKFPFIGDVYDQADHMLSVLQVTHLEDPS